MLARSVALNLRSRAAPVRRTTAPDSGPTRHARGPIVPGQLLTTPHASDTFSRVHLWNTRDVRRYVAGLLLASGLSVAGCTSGPTLPSGLMTRAQVMSQHMPGATRMEVALVAVEGPGLSLEPKHFCHWPSGCRQPYSFVWLRLAFGQFGLEGLGMQDAPCSTDLSGINARTGKTLNGGEGHIGCQGQHLMVPQDLSGSM